MSDQATAWAKSQATGSPTRKLVLLLLANEAGSEGEHAYPSLSRMAHEAECDRKTVQRAMRELEALGLIQLVRERRRPNGSITSREYRLCMERDRTLPPYTEVMGTRVAERPTPKDRAKAAAVNTDTPPPGQIVQDPPWTNCPGTPGQIVQGTPGQFDPPRVFKKELTPPTPPREPAPEPPRGKGGEDHDGEALAALRAAGLTEGQARRLTPLAAEAVAAGWTRANLTAHLTDDLPAKVHSLPKLIEGRLRDLPAPPKVVRREADRPITVAAPPCLDPAGEDSPGRAAWKAARQATRRASRTEGATS